MRAFLAVSIPTGLREQISALQQQLKDALAAESGRRMRITWVKPDAIHLTIKFFGEIGDDLVESLRASISTAIDGWPAIEIPFETAGAFPRLQAPRTLWIGPHSGWDSQDDAKRAFELAARIDDSSTKFGVPPDTHPWRPHLTLARVREGERDVGRALEASGLFSRRHDIGSLRIDELSLMKSEMRPDGPVYTLLWAVALPG